MKHAKSLKIKIVLFSMFIVFGVFSLVMIYSFSPQPPKEGGFSLFPPPVISPSAPGDKWDRISITSNADIPTYADSGSGTSGDPWIIQDYNIDNNSTGVAVLIQNTNEYIVLRNITVSEGGTGALEGCFGLSNVTHVTIEDSNASCEGGTYSLAIFSSSDVNVNNTTLEDASDNNLYIYETNSSTFSNMNITNSTNNVVKIISISYEPHDLLFDNINVVNTSSGILFEISSGYNINITNSYIANATLGVEPKGIRVLGDDVFINNTVIEDVDIAIQLWNQENATITYNTLDPRLDGVHGQLGNANNNYMAYNVIGNASNPDWIGDGFAFTNCENNTFYNNTLYGSTSNTTDSAFAMRNSDNDIISGNYIHGFDRAVQYITSTSTNLTIFNNTIENNAEFGLDIETVTGTNISSNKFINNDDIAVFIGSISNVNITGNNFTGNVQCITSTASSLNVSYNFFHDDNSDLMNGVFNNFSQNYYQDYFDQNPFAIANLTTLILNESYLVDGSFNDTEPLYYEDWFPRTETVNIAITSLVDSKGIFLEYIEIYVDDVIQISKEFQISHILYNLRIQSNGLILHDQVYNINGTGTELMVNVDFVNRVFFSFFSSIDGFGLSFETVKLFINDTRITTFAPTSIESNIQVKITDFLFNITLYDQALDLKTTGIYIDIGLLIAPITIQNNYNRTVIFHLSRNGISTSLAIGPNLELGPIRLAVGTYQYMITETDGIELIDREVTFEEDDPSTFVISFGFTDVPVGDTIVQNNLNIFLLILTFGGFAGLVIFFTFRGLPSGGSGGGGGSSSGRSSRKRSNPSGKKGFYQRMQERILRQG